MSTINCFYRNNCFEFRMIKERIFEYRFPTDKQITQWKNNHCYFYRLVINDINRMGEYFLDDNVCECPQDILECNGFSFVDYLNDLDCFTLGNTFIYWQTDGEYDLCTWLHKHDLIWGDRRRSLICFECDWHISYWDEYTQMYRVNKDVLDKICPP